MHPGGDGGGEVGMSWSFMGRVPAPACGAHEAPLVSCIFATGLHYMGGTTINAPVFA